MWDVRIGVDDLVGDGLGSTVVALIVVASINVNGETWAAAAVVKAGEGASAVRDAANEEMAPWPTMASSRRMTREGEDANGVLFLL